jgi:hypothetical protein
MTFLVILGSSTRFGDDFGPSVESASARLSRFCVGGHVLVCRDVRGAHARQNLSVRANAFLFQVQHLAFRWPGCQRINLHGKKRLDAERISPPLRFGGNIPPFAKMLTWRPQPGLQGGQGNDRRELRPTYVSGRIFLPMVEGRSLLE